MIATSDTPRLCRTPDEAFEAGRQLVRDRGDKLTPEQIARISTLVRPHLRHDDAA